MTEHMQDQGHEGARTKQEETQMPTPAVQQEAEKRRTLEEVLEEVKRTKPSEEEGREGRYYGHMTVDEIKSRASAPGTFGKDARVAELIKKTNRTPEEEQLLVTLFDPRVSGEDIAKAAVVLRVKPEDAEEWLRIQGATQEKATEVKEELPKAAKEVLKKASSDEISAEDVVYAAKVLGYTRERVREYADLLEQLSLDENDTPEAQAKRKEKAAKIRERLEEFETDEERARMAEKEEPGEKPEEYDDAIQKAEDVKKDIKEIAANPKEFAEKMKKKSPEEQSAVMKKINGAIDNLLNPEFSRRLALKIPVTILIAALVLYIYALYAATSWAKKK